MSDSNKHRYDPPELRPEEGRLPERSTVGAFLIRKGMLLLERRPEDARVYPGLWDTPGGHVEQGEIPEAALIRELREELGIEARRFFLGLVQDDLDQASGRFYRHYVYVLTAWNGEPASKEERTIQWFPHDEALVLPELNPLIGYALKEFLDKGWLKRD
ncbi:MAG: NUDIX domain-containing protein [Planctomycetota bacterium]|jgi:mutator protein MutT